MYEIDDSKLEFGEWFSLCENHFLEAYKPGIDNFCKAEENELMCQVDGCSVWATYELYPNTKKK